MKLKIVFTNKSWDCILSYDDFLKHKDTKSFISAEKSSGKEGSFELKYSGNLQN